MSVLGRWERFWMGFADQTALGRLACALAGLFAGPYKARTYLAGLSGRAYVSPRASIHHSRLKLGLNVFVGDGVVIYGRGETGLVTIGRGSHVHRDCILETGEGGSVIIGEETSIQPRCVLSAYVGSISIGSMVQVAPHCAFYAYDHTVVPGMPIKHQPLKTKGGIVVEDDAWLGFGVIVLDGVRIGTGAVVGAGSVVTRDVPNGAIAAGVPARVLKLREDFAHNGMETAEDGA